MHILAFHYNRVKQLQLISSSVCLPVLEILLAVYSDKCFFLHFGTVQKVDSCQVLFWGVDYVQEWRSATQHSRRLRSVTVTRTERFTSTTTFTASQDFTPCLVSFVRFIGILLWQRSILPAQLKNRWNRLLAIVHQLPAKVYKANIKMWPRLHLYTMKFECRTLLFYKNKM